MALLDRLLAPLSPAAALRRAMRLIEQGDAKQAFPLLARAARAGIAEAEFRVGRCYLEGAGVPPSRAEGARWLERAANQGYVEAQAQLATLALHGLTHGSRYGAPAPCAVRRDRRGRAGFRRQPQLGAQGGRGRLGRRPGGARLHPDLRTGDLRDLGRGASLVRALGRRRLPAGRPRLCAVAGAATRDRPGAAGAGGGAPAPRGGCRAADGALPARA